MLPPTMVVTFIHIQGGLKGEIQEFCESVITIGRLPSLTLHFPTDEPGVSRTHSRIEREGNQFKITDLSKYGTFVNGKQIKEAYLKNGDVMEFGPGGPKVSFQAEIVEGSTAGDISDHVISPMTTSVRPPSSAKGYSDAPLIIPPSPTPQPQQAMAPASRPLLKPEKSKVPLVIQFGPVIRSYIELPVIIGSDANVDFVLQHPGISGRHLQIFHARGAYWVKNLAGIGIILVNRERIDTEVELKPFDEIECYPGGPILRFIGEGRLVEVERDQVVPFLATTPQPSNPVISNEPVNENKGFFAKIFKGFNK